MRPCSKTSLNSPFFNIPHHVFFLVDRTSSCCKWLLLSLKITVFYIVMTRQLGGIYLFWPIFLQVKYLFLSFFKPTFVRYLDVQVTWMDLVTNIL